MNGVVAKEAVNVHKYVSVGNKIIDRMTEQPVFSCSFKRRDKATTMGDSYAVKVAPKNN